MKVVAKPIEMAAWFTRDGIPHPIKFRIVNEDESYTVIKIDKIICTHTEKLAGNCMYVFRCQSVVEGIERIFEIKYEISTCRWILFKI